MTVLDELASFVVSADPLGLPALDREILRRHLADTVVARIAGAASREGRLLAALEPSGSHTAAAIAALAASVRLTEVDDIHIGSCTTVSSVVVPVALGLAARDDVAPAAVPAAIWAGTELAIRFAAAIDGARVLYRGVWPTRTIAPLAAAAVTARMLGLDQTRTAQALSLALMMTAPRTGRFTGEPTGRWIVFMTAVGDGIRAAEAARAGFKADLALLEGSWLQDTLGVPVDMTALTSGLGAASVLPELSLKPFCTSRQALSATEAMRRLLATGLDPTAIEAVRVLVPSAYAAMIATPLDPKVRTTSLVSAGAQMAIAALAPAHLYDVDRIDILDDPRIGRFAARVEVAAEPALDELFPRRWPAEVEVRSRGGVVRSEFVMEPPGDPGQRLDDAGLEAKACAVLAHLGQATRAPEIIEQGLAATTDTAACRALARTFVRGL
jgi:2-methylcitrate dehydratase PrpD